MPQSVSYIATCSDGSGIIVTDSIDQVMNTWEVYGIDGTIQVCVEMTFSDSLELFHNPRTVGLYVVDNWE